MKLGESVQKSVLGVFRKVKLDGSKLSLQMAKVKVKMFVEEKVYVYVHVCKSKLFNYTDLVETV